MRSKTPIEHIRRNLFAMNQAEFAAIARSEQSVVSRWENGLREPTREQMASIREEAIRRGLPWSDDLFFEVPAEAAE